MTSKIALAVLGAGNRGRDAYGQFVLKNLGEVSVVAVAEPIREKRELFAAEHNIPEENQFSSWQELLERERLADGIIIATLDNQHVGPALAAMERGYIILLEKPIAPTWEGTLQVARRARELDATVLVAHVLRYTRFYRELKRLLKEDVIGRIRFVDHLENIGFYHFAHSYVRGNWRNTQVAAPIILAKSCHDMDLLFWLLDKRCLSLSSRGSLEYFKPENQPEDAADRCLFCSVEEDCPYSARKIYLTGEEGWPVSVISSDHSYQARYRALETGPYGRCVFKCDNNVPDVQTVTMTFEDNIEVNFALTAFSREINRITRFYGTLGEIKADLARGLIEIYKFGGPRHLIEVECDSGGHSGGDTGLMRDFIKLFQTDRKREELTDIEASLESHIMAFAAEEARIQGTVKWLNSWRSSLTGI